MQFETAEGEIPPRYHRFLGSKTGLISELTISPPSRSDPQAYVSAVNAPDPSVFRDGRSVDVELQTGGKSVDPDDVLVRGIGETCERYAMWLPNPADIRTATHEELTEEGRVVPFEYLSIHDRSDEESVFPAVTRETTVAWTEGTDLLTGESVSLPAGLVWNGITEAVGVPPRFPGTSNGCAAGERLVDALLGGLLEVIERDGIMRTWATRRTPTAIDTSTLPDLDGFLPNQHLSAHVWALESPVSVPALGAALVDERSTTPKFAIGGSAGVDAEAAAVDALAETAQSWRYIKQQLAFEEPASVDPDGEITNFDDNVLLYAQPEQFDRVSFLLEGTSTSVGDAFSNVCGNVGSSTEAKLDIVLDALDEADCTPIAVDITPPDIGEVGVRVVTVYVPELLPLTQPSRLPTEHPVLADEDVTTHPHPFP